MKRIIALSIGVIVLAFASWFLIQYFSDNEEQSAQPENVVQKKLIINPTDPFKGNRNAPISVIMVGSYGCPACKESAAIMDQLLALYPDTVKIVWKDLPEQTAESYRAAIAARCAQQQGKFWQYHDILYAKQDILAAENLYGLWAKDSGLRIQEFDACLEKEQTRSLVENNAREGISAGIESVPYFQINDGQGIQGSQSLFYFQAMVDGALKSISASK